MSVNIFILRLRELFHRWQERDKERTEERDDLLLEQLMVGLIPGPIKQELSHQMRRNERMTFIAICKEAPAPRTTPTVDLEHFKAELQQELMGEMKKEIVEQMKALSANLMDEMRTQFSSGLVPHSTTTPSMKGYRATSRPPQVRQRLAGNTTPAFLWDAQGTPICRHCGTAWHVQRWCSRRPVGQQDF